MKDLKLDFINKKVINELIDKKDRVIQQIRLAVNVWVGDWFLDETFGVDYGIPTTLDVFDYYSWLMQQYYGYSH